MILTMRWWILAGVAVAIDGASAAAKPVAVAEARRIIERASAAYDEATTIQGRAALAAADGKGRSERVFLSFRAENEASGRTARSWTDWRTSGRAIAFSRFGGGHYHLLDDGKQLFTILPARREYFVEPHAPDRFSNLWRATLRRIFARETLRYTLSTQKFEGLPVRLIVMKGRASTVRLWAGADDGALRKLVVSGTRVKAGLSLEVRGLVLGGPLPPNSFAPPPASYKRIEPIPTDNR